MRGAHQQPILRGSKIRIFLASIILASIFSVTLPTQAQAKGLFYTLGCTLKSVLSTKCAKEATPRPEETPSQSPTEPQQDQPKPAQSETSSPSSPAPEQMEPIVLDKKLTQRIPEVASLQTIGTIPTDASNSTANSVVPRATVLGIESTPVPLRQPAFIQPSVEGWKIVGVAWYWWLLTVAGLGAIFVSVRRYMQQFNEGM